MCTYWIFRQTGIDKGKRQRENITLREVRIVCSKFFVNQCWGDRNEVIQTRETESIHYYIRNKYIDKQSQPVLPTKRSISKVMITIAQLVLSFFPPIQ